MTITETLARYAEHDRRWIARYGDTYCRRGDWCPAIFPASVFAWCPPCREAVRQKEQAA